MLCIKKYGKACLPEERGGGEYNFQHPQALGF